MAAFKLYYDLGNEKNKFWWISAPTVEEAQKAASKKVELAYKTAQELDWYFKEGEFVQVHRRDVKNR